MADIKIRPAFLYQQRRCCERRREKPSTAAIWSTVERLSEKLLLSTKLLVRSIGKPCVYKKTPLLNNLEEMPLLYDYCFLFHGSYHLSQRRADEKTGQWREQPAHYMRGQLVPFYLKARRVTLKGFFVCDMEHKIETTTYRWGHETIATFSLMLSNENSNDGNIKRWSHCAQLVNNIPTEELHGLFWLYRHIAWSYCSDDGLGLQKKEISKSVAVCFLTIRCHQISHTEPLSVTLKKWHHTESKIEKFVSVNGIIHTAVTPKNNLPFLKWEFCQLIIILQWRPHIKYTH